MDGRQYPTEFRLLQQQAEAVVAAFRDTYGFPSSPPVAVWSIARELFGLRVLDRRLAAHGSHPSAGLIPDAGVIVTDENCRASEYSFSIGHELGHLILHEGNSPYEVQFDLGERVALSQVVRSARRSPGRAKQFLQEREANEFAAALLMPRSLLMPEVSEYQRIDSTAFASLGWMFGVSASALRLRLRSLETYGYWDGPPVDWDELRSAGFRASPRQPVRRRRQAQQGTAQRRVLPSVGQRVLKYLRRRRPTGWRYTRPFVIEFAGSPNAGKDTLIEIVADYLRDVHGAVVKVVDEAVSSLDRDGLSYVDQLHWTVSSTVTQLLTAVRDNGAKYDFVLVNRGLFDVLAQLEMAGRRGDLTSDQQRVLTEFVSYKKWVELTDLVFLLLISPAESLEREQQRTRRIIAELAKGAQKSVREQTIVNEKTLGLLVHSYKHACEHYADLFPHVCRLDFTSGPDQTTLEKAIRVSQLIPVDELRQLPIPALAGIPRLTKEVSDSAKPLATDRRLLAGLQSAMQLAMF